MVTRNVHLELAVDLTAETFLNLFRRFCAKCSVPRVVTSDHGTNLKATANFLSIFNSEYIVKEYMLSHQIEWKFIHVRSPWEGGFYERMIGVTKHCLRKMLYRKTLNLQQLTTLLVEIQARINNRPLTYVSSELTELESLTPAHLQYGRRINFMPPIEVEDELDPSYELDHRTMNLRYSYLTKLLNRYQNAFQKEYLTALWERYYGNTSASIINPIKEGDVVLVEVESNREYWPLGRVIRVMPDPDGIVRAVRIKSRGIESIRTLEKLIPLEINYQNSSGEDKDAMESLEIKNNGEKRGPRTKRAAAVKAGERTTRLYSEELV